MRLFARQPGALQSLGVWLGFSFNRAIRRVHNVHAADFSPWNTVSPRASITKLVSEPRATAGANQSLDEIRLAHVKSAS